MRLWKSGVDKKLIAKRQGHQDGGQLIMDTYTEVFGGDDADTNACSSRSWHRFPLS